MNFCPNLRSAVASAAAAALVLSVFPASAGGLFGKGGVFRGSVGKVLDRKIDKKVTPILKPVAKGLVAVSCGGAVLETTGSEAAALYAAGKCVEVVR